MKEIKTKYLQIIHNSKEWITEINNTQIENARDFDVALAMYNVIEYSDNYWKTSDSLW